MAITAKHDAFHDLGFKSIPTDVTNHESDFGFLVTFMMEVKHSWMFVSTITTSTFNLESEHTFVVLFATPFLVLAHAFTIG